MQPLSNSRIDATHIFKGAGAFILIILVIGYIYFQSRNLIQGPKINISTTEQITQTERMITLEGTAKNTTKLTINGKPIFTDASGAFSHTLMLENGYTIMTMHAEDRYGRTTTLTRTFVYLPSAS